MAAARQELLQAGYAQHMKRGFVSSGVRGGDVGDAATVVAPKAKFTCTVTPAPRAVVATVSAPPAAAAGGRPVFRPPVPVTQRPMYLTRPTETITRGPRRPQQQPAVVTAAVPVSSAAAQQAIAAAQAIAQRLAAQAVGVPAAAAAGSGANMTPLGGGGAAAAAYPGGPYAQYAQRQQQPQQQQEEYDPFSDAPAAPAQPQQQGAGGAAAYDPVAAAQAFAARLAQQHPHR
jgi:hypothetical protein